MVIKPIQTPTNIVKQTIPTRKIYDNVLWEEDGMRKYGVARAGGPFCPECLTPLAMKRGYKKIVDTHVREDAYYWEGGEWLFCLKCETEYFLSDQPKTLRDSRREAGNLLEGMLRREQEGQEG